MEKNKIVVLDLETTTADSKTGQIIEFGAIIIDATDPKPLAELPQLQCFVRHDVYKINAYCLNLNKGIMDILVAHELNEPKSDILRIINDYDLASVLFHFLTNNGYEHNNGVVEIVIAGKNVGSFDWQFLKEIPHFNSFFKVRSQTIDPAILSWLPHMDGNQVPSLTKCLERAGIKSNVVTHRAVEDSYQIALLLWHQYTDTDVNTLL